MEISTASLIARVRLALGETQESFAPVMHVVRASVQNWESGRGKPTPKRLRKMAEIAPQFARELRIAADKIEEEIRARRRRKGIRASGGKRGYISVKIAGRRYGEDTISSAHEALDLVIDNAPTELVKKVQEILDKHAGQWRRKT